MAPLARVALQSALAAALLTACTSEPPRPADPAQGRTDAVLSSDGASAGRSSDREAQGGDGSRKSDPGRAEPAASAGAPPGVTSAPDSAKEKVVAIDRYPWLSDSSLKMPGAVEPLSARFTPPAGFERVPVAAGSFGAWLRGLPLAAPGTPVLTYRGDVLLPADHENIAAVVAIDIGAADLQQCADSVIRLHAEWRWSEGARDMAYRAASGAMMPLARWMRGERPAEENNSLKWSPRAKPDPPGGDHASFRKYLDSVFTWANTGGLALQAKKITLEEARPGDFVVLPGSPGHAVLMLDMAVAPGGQRVALLGQGFMPAQSFQVLRPEKGRVWFTLDASAPGVKTPFWPVFPWDSLRRLDTP